MEIIDKLEAIKERWEGLREQLNDPELMNDMPCRAAVCRRRSSCANI